MFVTNFPESNVTFPRIGRDFSAVGAKYHFRVDGIGARSDIRTRKCQQSIAVPGFANMDDAVIAGQSYSVAARRVANATNGSRPGPAEFFFAGRDVKNDQVFIGMVSDRQ